MPRRSLITALLTAALSGCATLIPAVQLGDSTPAITASASPAPSTAPSTEPSAQPTASPTPNATQAPAQYAKPVFSKATNIVIGPISAPSTGSQVMAFYATAPATQDAAIDSLPFGIYNPQGLPNTWIELFNQTGVGSISLGRIGYGWSGGWYFPPTVQAAAGQHLAIIPKGTTKAFGLLADFSEIASTGSMTIALLSAPNSTESPLVNSTFTVARPRLTFTVSSDTPTSPIASNTVQVSLVRLIARSGEVPAPLYGLDFAVAFTEGMQTLNYRLTKGLMYIMIGDRQLSLAREGDGTYHVQFGYGATPLTTLEANSSVVFDLETDVGNATGSISASLTATAGNGIALATGSPIVQGPIRQITN